MGRPAGVLARPARPLLLVLGILVGLAALLWPGGASPLAAQPGPGQTAPAQAAQPSDEADRLTEEAFALLGAGDAAGALDRFNEALPLYRAAGDRLSEAVVLNGIGIALNALDRHEEAIEAYTQALTLGRELGEPAVISIAARGILISLDRLGATATRRGEYTRALEIYQRALTLAREAGDRRGEASELVSLGSVSARLADYAAARGYYDNALGITRALLAEARAAGDATEEEFQRFAEYVILNNLGVIASDLGDYARALDLLLQSQRILGELGERARRAGDAAGAALYRSSEGTAANNIGEIYNLLGQHERALDLFEQALAIAREVGDAGGESTALGNLASVYHTLGQHERARDTFMQALALVRSLGDIAGERIVLNNLGGVYVELGRFDQARAAYDDALAITRRSGDRGGERTALNNIGDLALREGRYAEGIDLLRQAVALARATGDRAGEAASLSGVCYGYFQLDQLEPALEACRQSIAATEDVRTAARLEEFKSSLAGQAGPTAVYRVTARILARLGRTAEAFDVVERARARSFLDQLGNARLDVGRGADPQLVAREQDLRGEISALDVRLRRELARPEGERDGEVLASLSRQLAEKQAAYQDLLTQLRLADPEAASLVSVDPLSLAQVQARLAPDESLLSYFVSAESTLVFIVERDDVRLVELPVGDSALRPAVEEFRRFADRTEAHPASLRRLHEWLIAPIRDQLTTPVVGIVPFGVLNYLPFAALTDGDRYFGDEHILFQVPSASVLPFINAKRKAERGAPLVVAQAAAESLPPLRFADREAQSIAGLYGVQPLLGRAATESAVKAQAGRFGILHLAAHGELNAESPLFSRIFLEPDAQNDGSLTLLEVYGLDLRATDLAVLSACSTELGPRSEGDDIVSLSRAFVYAGAPTVVASLWEVNDLATSVLMTAFYRNLQSGMTKAETLQTAQAETRAQFPSPFYWAAFTLTGDPG